MQKNKVEDIGRGVIEYEIIALKNLKKFINSNFNKKPKIYKRKFQLADVKKTHGSNSKIRNYIGKKKYTNIKIALNNTSKWYKKNWKVYF